MKYLQRLLCALCAFTLLLGCFSFTANAAEIDNTHVRMDAELWLESPFTEMFVDIPRVNGAVSPNVAGIHRYMKQLNVSNWGERYLTVHYRYTFSSKLSGRPLLYSGFNYDFAASGLLGALAVQGQEDLLFRGIYLSDNELLSVYVLYVNGQSEYIEGEHVPDGVGSNGGLRTSFKPKFDVRSIAFTLRATNPMGFLATPSWALIETGGDDGFNVVIDKDDPLVDEETNFFERILTKIQMFRDEVKSSLLEGSNQRRELWNSVKDTLTAITNLPQRIWSYMKNGLTNLFVPSEDFMKEWVEKNRQWCIETFGALYQSFDLIINAYMNIDASAETHFIDIPEVTIPLPDNQEFTFGGYSVRIVPEGFEYIASVCKAVVGIICTFAFINGMRRRYDDIMEETK